ncbi:glycosyltransferase [Ornithinimicrobium murale]|uniref:glycosyltransferase n=1 Tax=Ornithinimicrobium murale TaxID=1050153 RepID=UPI0013B3B7B2|nr:glycosyltransferase [Ornithinimicrobium murale]
MLVTLGSERFPFSRAVRVVARSLPPDAEVVWQLGHTQAPSDLPGTVHQWLPFDDMRSAAENADVVITHCGVGSTLMALRAGKCPVVFPRRSKFSEHVDDHQEELAGALAASGLAIVAGSNPKNVRDLITRAAAQNAVPFSPG